jgi:hypothetical protein
LEALDCTQWRTCLGRGFDPIIRQCRLNEDGVMFYDLEISLSLRFKYGSTYCSE